MAVSHTKANPARSDSKPTNFPRPWPSFCTRKRKSSDFPSKHFVHITPQPAFSRFDRSDQRMLGRPKVLGRVLVLRRIAATYLPAFKTQPLMHPRVPHLQALFASPLAGGFDFDLIEVCAVSHSVSLS